MPGDNLRMPNLLPLIPGAFLAPLQYGLPSPSEATRDTARANVQVSGLGRVCIKYRRMRHSHGRMQHWFWMPHYAEQISPVPRCFLETDQ